MNKLFSEHIRLVESVNNSTTPQEHTLNLAVLYSFRKALEILEINQLCECDYYYLDQGIDRPMCCGVFLDWKEKL